MIALRILAASWIGCLVCVGGGIWLNSCFANALVWAGIWSAFTVLGAGMSLDMRD